MFLDRKEETTGLTAAGAVAGYDINGETAQISYCLPSEEKPETISQVAGGEQFLIPAVLARQAKRDMWLYGSQAVLAAQNEEARLVTDLLSNAANQSETVVDGERFDPVALLSLFIKRSLSLLTPILPLQRLQALVFTVEEVTKPVIDALTQAAALLGLRCAHIAVVSRAESFFYYNICQPEELWRHDVLLCDLTGKYLKTYVFHVNRRTDPVAAFVEETSHEPFGAPVLTGDEIQDSADSLKCDREFVLILHQLLDLRQATSAYLIGAGFEGGWYEESLKILCRDRRVFLGNNLYSKGACYAARERLAPGSVSKGYVFLGKDMLKANVGMHVSRRAEDAYLALLDAGVNWYDARRECDFLLEEKNTFSLRITPLNGTEIREVIVTLTGLPERPYRTTRIHLKVDMIDVKTVRICMEDEGFGEFFPATRKLWEEIFQV